MQPSWLWALALTAGAWLAATAGRVLWQVLQLGAGGTAFLAMRRAQQGGTHAFIIGAFPPRLVFLFDPSAIRLFFTAPTDQIDFRLAVEHFTQRVFQLSNEDFFPRHQRLWRGLRNLLTGSAVQQRAAQLAASFEGALDAAWPVGEEVDLLETVKTLLFDSVAALIFGHAFVARNSAPQLRSAFFDFETGFEMAASPLPHALQPRFCAARRTLLAAFRASVAAGDFKGTLAGALLAECDIEDCEAPHIMLAVLWAAMANSVPAAFWTLAVLLLPSSRVLVTDIRAAAVAVKGLGGGTQGGPSLQQQAIQLALDSRSMVRLAADEAIRLFSHSIDVRVAARDLVLPAGSGRSIHVSKNSILAISPWLSHRDASFGEDPGAFRPQRYRARGGSSGSSASGNDAAAGRTAGNGQGNGAEVAAGDSSSGAAAEKGDSAGGIPGVTQTGMAFGGGRFRCPGRAFAEMEVALLTAAVLLRFDLTLAPQPAAAAASPEPWWQAVLCPAAGLQAGWKAALAPDAADCLPDIQHRRLVGIKWPASPCLVRVASRP